MTAPASPDLSAPGFRIEGVAIVSRDGMLAGADGIMPETLMFPGDQAFFIDHLNGMDVVVHGRHSEESHPNSAKRKRIIATRQVETLAPSPSNPLAVLWNPAGAPLAAALKHHGISRGALGVIGGTEVFSLFLDAYTTFYLSRAPNVSLPGGRPVFSGIPARSPEEILSAHRLRLASARVIDPAGPVTLEEWRA